MSSFYFPLALVLPEKDAQDVTANSYSLVIRRWEVSTFDLATLGTRHKLNQISYQLMDVFLGNCHAELRVEAENLNESRESARLFRAMLYLNDVYPFIMPFACNFSVNDYAGINSRDSHFIKDQLPEGLREGITSETATVEVWPNELTLFVLTKKGRLSVAAFERAAADVERWRQLRKQHPILGVVQDGLTTAPLIIDEGQSLLHIWSTIEALFPTVQGELTFRLAIYLTQLYRGAAPKRAYHEGVKAAYRKRSSIAHGGTRKVEFAAWNAAWQLLIDACRSILIRGDLPDEDTLIAEMFP